ncbi:MAG: hypothetical protein ACI8W7_004129 [Gammaproteobacteria bacterium]|jgi:hypothetical protein
MAGIGTVTSGLEDSGVGSSAASCGVRVTAQRSLQMGAALTSRVNLRITGDSITVRNIVSWRRKRAAAVRYTADSNQES